MNRKLLVFVGPVAVLVMFAGTVKMASWLMSREYRQPYGAPSVAVDPTPRTAGLASEAAAATERLQATPYEEAEDPGVPGGGKPSGDLGGRAAAPAVRGLRSRRPDLRAHRRGHWLQDGRYAIRPARARVRETPLRVFFTHGDVRRVSDVHAHHSLSEVHELFDERVLANLPPLRTSVLRGSVLPVRLLLRLGEVPSPGASWARSRPECRRHVNHADCQCMADVHDVAQRDLN